MPPEVLTELVKIKFNAANVNLDSIEYSRYSTSNEGLGKYLDTQLGSKKFASDTGTLKQKVNFCEKAVELMAQPDFDWQLPQPLKELCDKIYKFIIDQNK